MRASPPTDTGYGVGTQGVHAGEAQYRVAMGRGRAAPQDGEDFPRLRLREGRNVLSRAFPAPRPRSIPDVRERRFQGAIAEHSLTPRGAGCH